ncbi:SEC-C metal-binding domain-containing protein [Aneurinibacillus tyrosinisolvens]|uniref:SEC-C metal-binding domain-containing protein n=1 Tax=Aneurinibacillus tyrosinisolvens TaxID=1443435 RepID=UPI00063F7DD0|nr:SEC-C metal-binding domain-containing protein [Aneurinibacillus tyrosinisolvens]
MNRNEPCTCGSGKKYKKCCYASDQEEIIFKNKILIVNSYTVEEEGMLFIKADFLYDWIPFQLNMHINPELEMIAPLFVTHHEIFGNENLEGFKILEVGETEKMLRVQQDNYDGRCPFCKEDRYKMGYEHAICDVASDPAKIELIRDKLDEVIYGSNSL